MKETTAEKTNAFLDSLLAKLDVKNDAALARMLGTYAPTISKIRHDRLPIGPALRIKIHELTGWTFSHMREQLGEVEEKVAA